VTFDVSTGIHYVVDMTLDEFLLGVGNSSMQKPDYTIVVVSSTGIPGFGDYLLKVTPIYSNKF
jgi:hypothetical protein